MGGSVTAYLAANGAHVVTVNLLCPWYGAPVADVVLADATALSGSVMLTIANATFAMSVALDTQGNELSRAFAGQTYARLVGGAGAWGQPVTLAPLKAPPGGSVLLSTALNDLAMATKNPVSGKSESVALGTGLDRSIGAFYVPAVKAPAGALLGVLANPLWWVDTLGVTQVAKTRTGPAIAATAGQVEHYSGGMQWLAVATEDVKSWTTPGATYTSATVPQGITVNASRVRSGDEGVLRVEVLAA